MSLGLGHGRPLDPAPGVVLVDGAELPPMPDSVLEDPGSARVDPRAWFTHPGRPFEIEIGPGKGAFLIQQGALEAGTNYLGVEWAREFARYAADRVRRRHEHDGTHENIRVLHTDATQWLRWRVPHSIARVVHLYFSDPWPKSRHHKKRVIQHATLLDIWRVLTVGGELRVVTDHDDLWAWDEAHFAHWTGADTPRGAPAIPDPEPRVAEFLASRGAPAFEHGAFDKPGSAGSGELVGTNFERKFREQGRSFHACVLRKNA